MRLKEKNREIGELRNKIEELAKFKTEHEQTLLMVSHVLLGQMNEQLLIDSLLKTVYKELPQRPRWVDGSGLSRYNLFSPEDFVWLLNKLQQEFGMERMK